MRILQALAVFTLASATQRKPSPYYPWEDGCPVPYKGLPTDDPAFPPSDVRSYSTAAVATDTEVCSQVGIDIINMGGSAVDSIIATCLCVGSVNPHTSGIGGGHFMVIYEKPRGDTVRVMKALQAREWAPLASDRDMFVNNTDASAKGGLSIAVPGEVAGFYVAWQEFGLLDWAALFQPSIDLNINGFIVSATLSSAIAQYEDDIRADPNLSAQFVKPNGELYTQGDTMTNVKLASTLQRIADDPNTYYTGSLAQDIVSDIAEYGGIVTEADLAQYVAKMKDPVKLPLSNGDLQVNAVSPPSSGVIYQFIINILNGYMWDEDALADQDTTTLTYHRIIEAMKFAYAKRSALGDEDYVDVSELIANLTSPEYGEYIRSQINDSTTMGYQYYDPEFDISRDSGTASMHVLAPGGSSVALTSTVNLFFGSNVLGSRTGIIFNDEMDDFSTPGTVNYFGVPASPANYIEPGKMPMSSMNPSLILDTSNRVVYNSGAAGGTSITTATSFVTMHSLWFGYNLQNATDAARLHDQLVPEETEYERHMDPVVVEGLANKNHNMTEVGTSGVMQTIHAPCDPAGGGQTCVHAASDGRKGGSPAGF